MDRFLPCMVSPSTLRQALRPFGKGGLARHRPAEVLGTGRFRDADGPALCGAMARAANPPALALDSRKTHSQKRKATVSHVLNQYKPLTCARDLTIIRRPCVEANGSARPSGAVFRFIRAT